MGLFFGGGLTIAGLYGLVHGSWQALGILAGPALLYVSMLPHIAARRVRAQGQAARDEAAIVKQRTSAALADENQRCGSDTEQLKAQKSRLATELIAKLPPPNRGWRPDVGDTGVSMGSASGKSKSIAGAIETKAAAEVDKTYLGKVVRIVDFGAFVEILPGTEGLLHITESPTTPSRT
jgi:polyribonucleotide nucleotidyltransferase